MRSLRPYHPLAGLCLVTALIALIGLYAYRIPMLQIREGEWVMHTHEVTNALENLSAHLGLEDKEVSRRTVHARAMDDIAQLEWLTQDNPSQQERLQRMRDRLASAATKTELSQLLQDMKAEEARLLELRVAAWHASVVRTRALLMGGVTLLYGLVLLVYSIMRREARARQEMLRREHQAMVNQREIAQRLSQVVTIQREVAGTRLDLDALMQVITERTQAASRADGAVVEMFEAGEMVYRRGEGGSFFG